MSSSTKLFNTLTKSLKLTSSKPTIINRLPSTSSFSFSQRSFSSTSSNLSDATTTPTPNGTNGEKEIDTAAKELMDKIETQNKLIAELKDLRLRSLADFENLQKISVREKAQAKDFALTSFARDLISSIDILSLALNSIPAAKLSSTSEPKPNEDLVSLHEGVSLTKKEIERVLKRHGVVAFDPTGEQFDPNRHEALYQAPVPGKVPGSVLECQEIGYMIKDRLLRPAKVGVVLST